MQKPTFIIHCKTIIFDCHLLPNIYVCSNHLYVPLMWILQHKFWFTLPFNPVLFIIIIVVWFHTHRFGIRDFHLGKWKWSGAECRTKWTSVFHINGVANECWTFSAVIKISFHRQWTNRAGKRKEWHQTLIKVQTAMGLLLHYRSHMHIEPLFSLSVGLIVCRDL